MRRPLVAIACLGFAACALDDSVVSVGETGGGGADASLVDGASLLDGSTSDGSSPGDASSSDDSSFDSGPARYERSITIHGGKIQGSLTDFPVWIDLGDATLAAHAKSDGSDIFFTTSDGTALSYERQSYDPAAGHVSAWVKVPALTSGTDVALFIRYGAWPTVPAPNSAAVFSNGFSAVWHLEPPAGTTFAEALGVHPGTASGLSSSATVTAELGRGVAFDGGAGEITFTNPLSGNTAHTISMWVSQGSTTDNDALVVLGNGTTDQSRWFHSAYDNPVNNPTKIAVGFYGDDWVNPNVDIIGAGWTMLDWVYDGTNSNIFENGGAVAGPNAPSGPVNTQGSGGYLGNAPAAWGTNMGAHATLDEVRIANVARTTQWIGTELASQSSPTTFYAVGAEQLAP
ncbi:MAG: DUF2341 domain-containing protein [Polyangiaceae bacterium]